MSRKAVLSRFLALILLQALCVAALDDTENAVLRQGVQRDQRIPDRRDPGQGVRNGLKQGLNDGREPAQGARMQPDRGQGRQPIPDGRNDARAAPPQQQRGSKLSDDFNKNRPQMGDRLDKAERQGGQRNKIPSGIASSPECGEDVERICGHRALKSNLEVLACMTNNRPTDEDLSDECHQHLWQAKLNITKDSKFHAVASQICEADIKKIPNKDCTNLAEDSGKLIPCLLDHKDEMKSRACYNFLVKMGTIIYSDYRLICNFVDECKDDIIRYRCGRVDSATQDEGEDHDIHSQGAVVECLEQQLTEDKQLTDDCAKQIVRLTELTSDDFHLDRNLFFKCRDDRERMCEEVVSGEGRVYKCLFQHKFDPLMSSECREALTMRQKLVAHDYKASYDLHAFCNNDIEKHKCLTDPRYAGNGQNDHNDIIGLSGVLLCLEGAQFGGNNQVNQQDVSISISEQCRLRLDDFRRMLGEDYQLSPEIVKGCEHEITQNCGDGVSKEGQTIHCLMGLAEDRKQRSERLLGKDCEMAIMHLLKEDHAVSDYRMDYALAHACNPVIITACGSYQEGDPMVLSCLMEHLNADVMKAACRKRLLELQYFIGRDFYLDPKFFKKCHTDADHLCDVKDFKHTKEVTMPYSLVVSCLYRHIAQHSAKINRKTETSRECAEEVLSVMKQRALDMNLNPELEEACRIALGEFCSEENHETGTEFQCLQENISNITDANCVEKIEEVTEIEEAEAGRLDDPLMAACELDIEEQCSEELNSEDEGAVMDCLIEKKSDLNEKCRAGITHLQILEMEDVKFSYSFMKSCKKDIDTHCADLKGGRHTKLEVVHCLSGQNMDSKIHENLEALSPECSKQLTVENLQRHEDIQLNPELNRACQSDLKKFCGKLKKSGNAKAIECLRSHKNNLSKACRIQIYGLEKEEVMERQLDFALMRSCKAPIKKYCQQHLEGGNTQLILDCLVHNKQFLDQGCRDVVIEREIEEFSDIELNPQLKEACQEDIAVKCKKELTDQHQDETDGGDLTGRVIACLKKKFISKKKDDLLTQECSRHIKFVMKEEENDYRLDPMLALKCVEAIKVFCDPKRGNVIECLKKSYFHGDLEKHQECTVEVARLLKEGRSDIMADPILHNLCSEDIHFFCRDVPEGQGKIMGCLLDVAERGGRVGSISPQCSDALHQRKKMWSYAAAHHVAGFEEMSNLILDSPHKSYLLTVITIFILCILILGMLCGRVTKRVTRQRKML